MAGSGQVPPPATVTHAPPSQRGCGPRRWIWGPVPVSIDWGLSERGFGSVSCSLSAPVLSGASEWIFCWMARPQRNCDKWNYFFYVFKVGNGQAPLHSRGLCLRSGLFLFRGFTLVTNVLVTSRKTLKSYEITWHWEQGYLCWIKEGGELLSTSDII